MAKKKKEKRDEIVEDIESSLASRISRRDFVKMAAIGAVGANAFNAFIEPGTLITVHPNGLVEVATGRMVGVPSGGAPVRANDHVSCCCCHP